MPSRPMPPLPSNQIPPTGRHQEEYDPDLLLSAPELTLEQRQAGYDTNLLHRPPTRHQHSGNENIRPVDGESRAIDASAGGQHVAREAVSDPLTTQQLPPGAGSYQDYGAQPQGGWPPPTGGRQSSLEKLQPYTSYVPLAPAVPTWSGQGPPSQSGHEFKTEPAFGGQAPHGAPREKTRGFNDDGEAQVRYQRPWWKRPKVIIPVVLIVIAVILAVVVPVAVTQTSKSGHSSSPESIPSSSITLTSIPPNTPLTSMPPVSSNGGPITTNGGSSPSSGISASPNTPTTPEPRSSPTENASSSPGTPSTIQPEATPVASPRLAQAHLRERGD